MLLSLLACDAAAPDRVIWAWDAPHDLRALDPDVGVAAWVATITTRDGQLRVRPRRSALALPDGVWLAAVVRVESDGPGAPVAALGAELLRRVAVPGVRMIQLDWDARPSERADWRALVAVIDAGRPADVAFSVTAIASRCLDDDGSLATLPAHVLVVPMLFTMGPDAAAVRSRWAAEGPIDRCRAATGLADDEPEAYALASGARWIFHAGSWSPADLAAGTR